jgi:tryptophanase
MRLALPSRVYSMQYRDFVAASVASRASLIDGLQLISAQRLRSGFLAKYRRPTVATQLSGLQVAEETLELNQ